MCAKASTRRTRFVTKSLDASIACEYRSLTAPEEFRSLGIKFVSYQENIDTSGALGQALFAIVSVVAQLERDLFGNSYAGIRNARANGKKLGRPNVLWTEAIHQRKSCGGESPFAQYDALLLCFGGWRSFALDLRRYQLKRPQMGSRVSQNKPKAHSLDW